MRNQVQPDSETNSDFTLNHNGSSLKPLATVQNFIGTDEQSKDSDITSNLDSVDSFLQLRGGHKTPHKGTTVDVGLLHAQANADQFSTEHLNNVIIQKVLSTRKYQRFQINRTSVIGNGNFSFVQKKDGKNSAIKIAGRQLIPKIIGKYADEESLLSNCGSAAEISVPPLDDRTSVLQTPQSKSCFASRSAGRFLPTTGSPFGGGKSSVKKVQKKAIGRDVRFQIKDMEMASLMDEKDFLNGNFQQPSHSAASSAVSEKQKVQVFKNSSKPTPNSVRSEVSSTIKTVYFQEVSYPLFDQGFMFPQQQLSRLKKTSNQDSFIGQLKQYFKDHSKNNFPASEIDQTTIQGQVLSIEVRRGITCLICREIKNECIKKESGATTPTKIDQEQPCEFLFKIILNPILSKINVRIGDLVTIHGVIFKVDMRSEKLQGDYYQSLVQLLLLPQFLVNDSRMDDESNASSRIIPVIGKKEEDCTIDTDCGMEFDNF